MSTTGTTPPVRTGAEARKLIDEAFPMDEASLDSVHEKSVRHGHISTLHIWPARRPLAACRAALIATLLPDPGNEQDRKSLLLRMGGRVRKELQRKKLPGGRTEEKEVRKTEGGVLHWTRESGPDMDWFRERIREAYGGRAPRVLDPFAGGGAIPLEAMRLGCEVTASDLNPVAWFLLRCTLEHPQRLAGQKRTLPPFVREDRGLLESRLKSRGVRGTKLRDALKRLAGETEVEPELFAAEEPDLEADLSWHVRAWGGWVLRRCREELQTYYPRVGGEQTVTYLWARTVKCKNCRAMVPLLKTRWLCRKDEKRVLLTMQPNEERTGVVFGVETDVPKARGNPAEKREHDRKLGAGTMSSSGAKCPCCEAIVPMEDLRLEGRAERLGAAMTAVIVEGPHGKAYRLPVPEELNAAERATGDVEGFLDKIPFGRPTEETPGPAGAKQNSSSLRIYGLMRWDQVFLPRQLLALASLVAVTRQARQEMDALGYPPAWRTALLDYLALVIDRVADRGSTICTWTNDHDKIRSTFARLALPMTWDFAESVPHADSSGGYPGAVEWAARYLDHSLAFAGTAPSPTVVRRSAAAPLDGGYDLVVTDPPYYDAISYADLMDFFYIWLRRTLAGTSPEMDEAFREPLSPKWDHDRGDGELIDNPTRFGGDKQRSKKEYEDGMARAFKSCHDALAPDGRLVVVFAHKHPDAWETLVAAIIRAGFVVEASWPIQTERMNRTRALSSAALSSSVWLVCRKRPENSRAGWDTSVLLQMRSRIEERLRAFWDAGIRGPDFVWSATGPALEAYSAHPRVKKADHPDQLLEVPEFLHQVRRIVVDFVVGRVLSPDGGPETAAGLDDVTTYYLLHRKDFGLDDAPAGACILYAVSCGLSDQILADQYDLLTRGKAKDDEPDEDDDSEDDDEPTGGGSGSLRLKRWSQRQRKGLGVEVPGGRAVPMIDQVHHLMHLWRGGDLALVNEYVDRAALRRNALFHQVLQALLELSPRGDEERTLLESISNHLGVRGVARDESLLIPEETA